MAEMERPTLCILLEITTPIPSTLFQGLSHTQVSSSLCSGPHLAPGRSLLGVTEDTSLVWDEHGIQ